MSRGQNVMHKNRRSLAHKIPTKRNIKYKKLNNPRLRSPKQVWAHEKKRRRAVKSNKKGGQSTLPNIHIPAHN